MGSSGEGRTGSLTDTINALVKAGESLPHDPLAVRPIMDSQAFDQVVESRRSVRIFTGEPISDEVMLRLIDLATMAPSSSNLQPWEFHWVRTPEKKAELVKACLSQPAAKTAGELVVIVARTGTWRRNIGEMVRRLEQNPQTPKSVLTYYHRLVPAALSTGPLGLFSVVKWVATRVLRFQRPTPQEPITHSDVRIWAHKSTALAAQTMMLAARAHQLDSCPMEGFDSWRVKRLLNLPCDAEISMVLGLGVAKPSGIYGPRVRFDRTWHAFTH
jgi:nitroreductase